MVSGIGSGLARATICLLVLAGAASLLAAGSASAATRPASVVLESFELAGSNGYSVEVVEGRGSGFPPSALVTVERQRSRASYEAPAEPGPGMHAGFGSLGSVSLGFSRRKRTVERRGRGCVWIIETGLFRGDFSFVGEGGYTAATSTSVPGEVLRLPNGFCGLGDRIRLGFPIPDALRHTQLSARAPIPHGFVQFTASAPRGRRELSLFEASTLERIGAMKISRSTTVAARGGVVLGPGRRPRRADVAPPPPFQGTAQLRAPAGAKPRWTGSLRVSLPGAPDTSLAGDDFAARICPDIGPLTRCGASPRPDAGNAGD